MEHDCFGLDDRWIHQCDCSMLAHACAIKDPAVRKVQVSQQPTTDQVYLFSVQACVEPLAKRACLMQLSGSGGGDTVEEQQHHSPVRSLARHFARECGAGLALAAEKVVRRVDFWQDRRCLKRDDAKFEAATAGATKTDRPGRRAADDWDGAKRRS